MSNRLAEVAAHMETTRQLGAVIAAMRAIAASRMQEAQRQLDGIRAYAATVGKAIAQALSLAPQPAAADTDPAGAALAIVLCAEEGFAGAFSEMVLAAVPRSPRLFVVGERGRMALQASGRPHDGYAPMVLHPEQVGELADRLAAALYAELAEGRSCCVVLVHAMPVAGAPVQVVRRQLVPFDYARFPAAADPSPYLTLPPVQLIEQLASEYVYAELCEALVLSHAAENQARMEAMIAAHGNIERRHRALAGEYNRVRQEEITSEIVELSAGRR